MREFAAHGPRDVEQIVDQRGLRAGVALDALEGASGVTRRAGRAQHLRPPEQRVERRPQLVRQRRKEFFLQAIGIAGVAIQERVVERQAGP